MSDTDTTDEWVTPGWAAKRYDVTRRTIERWGNEGHVRTRPNPRRRGRLYHARDLERYATGGMTAPAELEVEPEPEPSPTTELVPQGDLLRMLDDAQRRAERAMLEVGRLQGQLESQQKLLESGGARQHAAEAEAERLRRIIQRIPWWVRMLWARDT